MAIMVTEMDSIYVSIDGNMRNRAVSFARRKLPTLADTVRIRDPARKERDLRIGHLAKEGVLRVLKINLGIPEQHIEEYDRIRTDQFVDFALWEIRVGNIQIDIRSSMEQSRLNLRQIVSRRHHLGYCSDEVTLGTPPNTRPIRDFEKSSLSLPQLPRITARQVENYIQNNTRIKDLVIRAYFLKEDESSCHIVGWVTKEDLIKNGKIGQLPYWPRVIFHLLPIKDGRPMDELRRFLRERGEIG
jgi:hypothetical protein